jgi:N-glycosylase/DNA lyase
MYSISNGQILIEDTTDFVPEHILGCGQTFRYYKTESGYKIFSKNLFCSLIYDNHHVIISSNQPAYFVHYFDLGRDYGGIKSALSEFGNLKEALAFGSGIRILNQDPQEMIFSFILSANNNIPRIRGIIERLCERFGEDMGGYRAFPTAERLAEAKAEELRACGAGYRADYILQTARDIRDGFSLDISRMDTPTARKHLSSLKGVGSKVADCILLFGYHREDVFPTDIWIERVYQKYYASCGDCSREQMARRLAGLFGNLSGYAQQYLFYHTRSNKDNNYYPITEETK